MMSWPSEIWRGLDQVESKTDQRYKPIKVVQLLVDRDTVVMYTDNEVQGDEDVVY